VQQKGPSVNLELKERRFYNSSSDHDMCSNGWNKNIRDGRDRRRA